ncbi:hypothetical protein B1A99_16720 [Cohnella sp. CIP 111063]|uniref:DUF1861 family protein n=1 Tax=unclassified Cohnella TaxID=2636738 RepID=UPI000B8C03C0|nr:MULTISPECIES: DUF1861 family protein [unclassified Cohnella]OXS57692.1 hypothetical protein B1A99_16720 [Cohnella sp. CIP 111063]PRX71084.1 uncharacterized protein DUF1861 [Cohnella sp. SGD-V74]
MDTLSHRPQSCMQLLEEYAASCIEGTALKLRFAEVGGRDVYNITAPFKAEGVDVIAGRVEARDSEDAEIVFFAERDGWWRPLPGAPSLPYQDPFVCSVGGEWIVGGVEAWAIPDDPNGFSCWRTVFFRGKTLGELRHFATGPDLMKDIRLLELPDGRIAVCTRPQGAVGGLGQIGFTVLDSLEQLTAERLEQATIYDDQFIPEEWGGANELHLLSNGDIGVLGHIARYDEAGDRHYYPMTFAIRPDTGARTAMKIIAVRSDFEPGSAKRPDLTDILFSGGLKRLPGGRAALYVGASDAEAHVMHLPDPFLEYEQSSREELYIA